MLTLRTTAAAGAGAGAERRRPRRIDCSARHARIRRRGEGHPPPSFPRSPFRSPLLRFHCHSAFITEPLPAAPMGQSIRPLEAHQGQFCGVRSAHGLFVSKTRVGEPQASAPHTRCAAAAFLGPRCRCWVVDAVAATGMEDDRVRREDREEEEDDVPQLSAAALEALKEFLAEQQEPESDAGEGEGRVELVTEDWRLSQFWYDERTARMLVEEVIRLASPSAGLGAAGAVACIACPTLYAYLKKSDPGVPAQLLEYDERFGQYGGNFTFYDYNRPEELPPAMKHAYRVVVADPPYLSRECLEKVAKTVSFLAQPEGSFLLLLTGEVQKDRALELLNVHPCGFKPQHSNKLGNEFRLFTNYDPADRLGGWERSDTASS